MKNYIQEGDCFEVVTPSGGYTSGQIVIVGNTAGIAAGTYVEGQVAIIKTKGVYEVAKDSSALVQGTKLYVSSGLTITSEFGLGDVFLGYAHADALTDDATVRVLLAR